MRLFPSPRPIEETSVTLSILDATVARFSNTGAIWMFDAPLSEQPTTITLIERLRSSFTTTLALFPQWAGQLQWTGFRPGGNHRERFNRFEIKYGSQYDPGVDWKHVSQPYPVISIVPLNSTERRSSNNGVWIATDFPQKCLLSDTLLALHDLSEYEGLPAMSIQINTFTCRGYAVAVKMAHPLADAQSLMIFMHQWAATSRSQAVGHPIKSLMDAPVFKPSLLDSHATGDIDASAADPDLTFSARSLPLHRFDWWQTSAPGYLDLFKSETETTKPPSDYLSTINVSPSVPGPWHTWDLFLPVEQAQFHFNQEELIRLRNSARTVERPDISRLDTLLTHIWALINRARGLVESSDDVYLNVTLSARTRVSPPLPESFIGSPLFLTHVRVPGSIASDASLRGINATAVRETISLFTPERLGAMLHDAAHEVSPQRLWQGFLGKYHTLVTSWMHLRVYDIDFEGQGEGRQPRYVHAVMPKMDGIVQIMDSGDEDGVDVSLYLEKEAMGRLLIDSLLRSFKH